MWLRICFLSSFFMLSSFAYILGQSISVSLLPSSDDSFSVLDGCIEQPVFIEKLCFQADIYFTQTEFTYLTGLAEHTVVTLEKLKQACWYLKRKNKFDTLDIVFAKTAHGVVLTFVLKAAWTFSKVTIKGALVGKEQYYQYYTLEPGELFDIAKHQYALIKVQQELKNNGYIQAHVTDQLLYTIANKTVSVVIQVEHAHPFVIRQKTVQVQGSDRDLKQELRNLEQKLQKQLNARNNGIYNYYALEEQKEEIKAYLIRKGFFNAQVTLALTHDKKAHTVTVVYTVEVNQQKRFVFFGNHFFSTTQLLSELIDLGASALFIPPALFAEDIIHLYKKRGFWQVRVEWREELHRFFFLINEGPRSSVPLVTLRNAVSIPADELVQKACAEFYKATYFDADLLKQATDKIIQEYMRQGFWDAALVKQEFISFDKVDKEQQYELVLTLDEGVRRWVKAVIIEQFPALAHNAFFAVYNTGQPKPFDLALLQEQRQWLVQYLRAQGLYYAQVAYKLESYPEGIVIIWTIDTFASRVYFGKTVLAGSLRIAPELLLRELCYKEDDLFTKEKIDQTVKRLKDLAIFQSVSLGPYNRGYPEKYKTMVLTCVEDDPFEVRIRCGLQKANKNFLTWSGTTYKLGGALLWKNPCCKADIIRLEGDITRYTRDISIGYEVPWLYNYPLRTCAQVYSTRYQQPIIYGSRDILYNEAHDGFLLQFDRAYGAWQTHMATGFELFNVSGLSQKLAQVIQFDRSLVNTRVPVAFIEGTLVKENYNNKLYPTSGSFTLLSARLCMCLQNYQDTFLKVLYEQAFITPVYKSIIGALRIKCGYIFNKKLSMLTPTERFYLGGPTSLRGYDYTIVPPLTLFVDSCGLRWWVPVGGKSIIDVTAELRFPVYTALSGAVFTDLGVLGQDSKTIVNFAHAVASTGLGLRYETPLGPLRFDIGFKWRKFSAQEKRYAWFLTFGHMF